jgi:hypothetical protein
MCLKCHMGMSDAYMENSLTKSIANPDYHVWNTTSLSHLYLSGSGMNGQVAQAMAIVLLDGFIQHVKGGGSTAGFVLEKMPPIEKIEAILAGLRALPAFTDVAERKEQVFHGGLLNQIEF